MERSEFDQLIRRLEPQSDAIEQSELRGEEIDQLSAEQAAELVTRFGTNRLITLPERERTFFEWLRANDPPIWQDLWGGEETPYVVSLAYLQDLLPRRRGFLICDLVDNENFCFTSQHITAEEGKLLLDAAIETIKEDGQLTLEQAFITEVWRAPIDLWRFSYMYDIELSTIKQLVHWLIEEGILIRPDSLSDEASEEAADDDDAGGTTTGMADKFPFDH